MSKPRSKSTRALLLVFVLLLAVASACVISDWQTNERNDIRRVALAYAENKYGPVDQVLVQTQDGDIRANLGRKASRTVWLFTNLASSEYFSDLPVSVSYIYLHAVNIEGSKAILDFSGRNGEGNFSEHLSLSGKAGSWKIDGF